jgi:hypothetical protein
LGENIFKIITSVPDVEVQNVERKDVENKLKMSHSFEPFWQPLPAGFRGRGYVLTTDVSTYLSRLG